ncbi:spore protease YyaC [Caldanaerobacter subterraneus]|uniref:Sporulation protein YyaC n=2 Tax=Caldanaerobacter subterraneus TaxID=911092 RepID=U5CZ34_CALSX|nr:spore protease YyaC [Caldanaerobacter subterraneus]ERM93237.1 sporulation protein YyaC [Caldanaerobacter subterraneus subsp. yonseiensis KB-1]TCO63234.1 putative sporulation protein YyaC [Caldanaerobacter subterraneus]
MEELRLKYNEEKASFQIANFLSRHLLPETVFLCIGTDRFITDSLGPIVGNLISGSLPPIYYVYGTLKNPVHAINLEENLRYIKKKHPYSKIIAVDASLGEEENIGKISIKKSPIHPGKGVGKILPPVGDLSIVGIVDSFHAKDLNSIRLGFIYEIAETIANGILIASYSKSLSF